MPDNKINRLNELNKLLFKLYAPKKGDLVKFKVRGQPEIYDGEITGVDRRGNQLKYSMVAKGDLINAPHGMRDVVIIECNGIKFQEIDDPAGKSNNFKFKHII